MLQGNPRLIAGTICHLLLCGCLATAQDSTVRAAPEPGKPGIPVPASQGGSQVIEESRPPLYYLKDKQGSLQAVPGLSYEEFEDLYKLKLQLTQGQLRPRYSLQQISISGTAAGEQADLTIQFRVLLREDQWTRVPLGLDGALLREPATYKGPGEQFLHFEPEGEGYVSWIRGQSAQQHELTLKLLVPLTVVGEETRLRLLLPRATSAELRLRVPVADAVAKVPEGAAMLGASPAGNGATELRVGGPGGDFQMTWRRAGGRAADTTPVLEASGVVLAKLDSRGVDCEATLSVRSHGAAFDRFRVRLPPGAEPVVVNVAGYTVKPTDQRDAVAPKQPLVEVQLTKKTSGPVQVRLSTRHAPPAEPDQCWELAGFEVVGAAPQSGTIAVTAPGDWQVLWGPSDGVRQVEQLPAALRQQDVVAGFDYFAQPYRLAARLVRKQTRVSVEPDYQLSVDPDQVRLEARLKYTVRGARVFDFKIPWADWELDEVGPEGLVAVDGVTLGEDKVLSIPLLQPSTGTIEVRIRAHRAIPDDATSLVLPLPQPRANAVGPMAVTVAPADNVELVPKSAAMVGLLPEPAVAPRALPGRQQPPLFYRGEGGKAVFAADFRVHPQRIAAAVISQLSLDAQGGQVTQRLAYTIAYEPARELELNVPRQLVETSDFVVLHEGKPLRLTPLADRDERPGAAGPLPVRVALPRAWLGPCELSVRYPLVMEPLPAQRAAAVTVPLVMPVEAKLLANELHVSLAAGLKMELRPGPWRAMENPPSPPPRRPGVRYFSADRPTEHAEFSLQAEPADDPAATIVDRAWVQTWLTSDAHEERAVFRFTSSRKDLEITLPGGAALGRAIVLLDGKPVAAQTVTENQLLVPLSGDASLPEHVLELRYHFPEARPSRGTLSIDFPQLGRDTWVRRLYWQLVLPRAEHVIAAPEGWVGEFTWGWQGYFWGRKPLLDQANLETWSGAPHRPPVPAATNCYLFSSLGNVGHCELRTAGRAWIVLVASGGALVAGLLLIYLPASRHPATLLSATAVLVGVGIVYPEPTLLVAQAASLGLVLTLLAGLLERSVSRRRAARGPVAMELPIAIREGGSTGSHRPPPAPSNQVSTQTAPAVTAAPPEGPNV